MPNAETLRDLAISALDAHKALDIQALDVRQQTDITDYLIVASGNSDRQLRALAEAVLERVREQGVKPLGKEGLSGTDWMLVDLGDVVIHLMRPEVRDFYQLERLWGELPKVRGQVSDLH